MTKEARLSVIGAIFMALKDPTLRQGFENICKELEAEMKLNAEIKARFVKCNTCTDEMKSKCLMFSENLCEGERCEELVDLMGLISKSELEESFNKAKELLKWFVWYFREGSPNLVPYKHKVEEAEQFISEVK